MWTRVKQAVAARLPDAWRRRLRRWRAFSQVRGFRDADWPYSPLVRCLVREGDCVVDAGANIGYLTARLAAWVGPRGRVHSIEPIPETYALLADHVRRLGLVQVRLHACAVSDRGGEAVMEVPRNAAGGENFYESHIVAAGGTPGRDAVRVPLRTLDELLDGETRPVSFLKIDVEGHERPALAGAARVLATHRPALLVEVAGDPDRVDGPAAALFGDLAERGYHAWLWRDGRLDARRAGQRAVDYLFLMPHHAEQFAEADIPRGTPT